MLPAVRGATFAVGAAGLAAYYYWWSSAARRVQRLISASISHYHAKRYEQSLEAAEAAVALAKDEAAGTAAHLRALMHLAGTHSAMRNLEAALAVLDEAADRTRKAHGDKPLHLVPVLNAQAEVLDQSGAPLSRVAGLLAEAREIRSLRLGENSRDFAAASFNLARVLVRGSDEAGAGGFVSAERRKMLLEQACALTLEAAAAAARAGAKGAGVEYLSAVMQLMAECECECDGDGGEGGDAMEVAAARLREEYREMEGAEWEGEEGGAGEEGGGEEGEEEGEEGAGGGQGR